MSRRNKYGLDETCAAKRINSIVNIHKGATQLFGIDAPTDCLVPVLPVMICVAGRASAEQCFHSPCLKAERLHAEWLLSLRLNEDILYVSFDALSVPLCTCTKVSMQCNANHEYESARSHARGLAEFGTTELIGARLHVPYVVDNMWHVLA